MNTDDKWSKPPDGRKDTDTCIECQLADLLAGSKSLCKTTTFLFYHCFRGIAAKVFSDSNLFFGDSSLESKKTQQCDILGIGKSMANWARITMYVLAEKMFNDTSTLNAMFFFLFHVFVSYLSCDNIPP